VTDILLTHSYHLYYDSKQTWKMQPYPPLGTLYAAALLRRAGHSVAVFDTMLNDPERGFHEALERHRPKIVVIYEDSFNFLSKMCLTRMRQVAYKMLQDSQRAGAMVLVNGSDASDHKDDYLRAGFLCVLLGEAEWTLLDAVQRLMSRGSRALSQVHGIAYLDLQNGSVMETPRRPQMRRLDELPFPARDLIDVNQYREAWQRAHGSFSLNIVSSRGCPYRCNWCAKPIYGNSFSIRSPQNVAAEIRELKFEHGAHHLWFADDIFGLRPGWVEEFATELEALDAVVPFKMQSRVDLMTATTAQALRRSGCSEVWMGAESGSQKVLDAMDKGTRIEQIIAARENLRREGIRACYFLQFGYPGESWEDINETVNLVRTTRPDDVGVSVSYPLPGTVFFERVRAQLGAKTNWADSGDLSMMFQGAYTDEFYRALHDFVHAEVDSWNAHNHCSSSASPIEPSNADPPALWTRVVELEATCRRRPPALPLRISREPTVQPGRAQGPRVI
jgi:anaerobic magnesium-protoporphyrin IX monomethyl ester cyclase